MTQRLHEGAFVHATRSRTASVPIEGLARRRDERIAGHVRRPGVEGDHVVGGCGRDQREVGDPAQVEHRDRRARREEDVVAERDQRCALAARGHVRAPEVAHRRQTGRARHARSVADLERRVLRGKMRDGLSVQRDDVRASRQRRDELRRCCGVRVAEVGVQSRDIGQRERDVGARAQHRLPQARRVGAFGGRDEAHARSGAGLDLDGGEVDAVSRRAGHHPDGDHVSIVMRRARIPLRAPRCGSGRSRRRCSVRSTRGWSAAPP